MTTSCYQTVRRGLIFKKKTRGISIRNSNILLWFFLSFASFHFSQAQFANQWTNAGKQYYKIQTAREGIYKLTYADLQTAGIPVGVGGIDPRRLQLFHRGTEQSIFVQGQADAVLHTTDYLEFYGKANDGTLDKSLYQPSTSQPHSYYNLFSDTTAYFLTWNLGAVPGKRVTSFDEVNVTGIPRDEFHWEEQLRVLFNEYSIGNGMFVGPDRAPIQYTSFGEGEGWTGKYIRQGGFIDYPIDLLTNGVTTEIPSIEILLTGRDEDAHLAEVLVGPNVSSLRSLTVQGFNNFENLKINLPLNWSDIGADGKMIVRLSDKTSNTRPQFSASYIKVSLPQGFQSSGLTNKTFNIKSNPGGKSYVEFENAPAGMRLWDVTDASSIISIGTRVAGSARTAVIGSTETSRRIYAFTTSTTPILKKVSFRLIDPRQADYIIISNQLLMKPALSYSNPVKAYAGYRASAVGGSYDTLVVTMDQLYNQFNYGETSPVAIYEFMKFMLTTGQPRYLFLIGKGRDVWAGFNRLISPGPSIAKDLVPSAGYPGSDMNYTVGLGGTTYEPAVPTGRLSVTRPEEVAYYLNKIIETENPEVIQDWQKRGLHLSGGITLAEQQEFIKYMDGFKSTAEGIYWGASVNTIAKQDPNPVETIDISDDVNEGLNLITYFGHSAANLIEIDIGFVTDPVFGYNNKGKYPSFLINGCNAGSFFLNSELLGENWVNASNKGARNFIGHSSYGFPSPLRSYTDYFYRIGFADSVFIGKGIGDVQKEVARQYMLNASPVMANITQVQQMVLLGDPAVRLFQYSEPDYEITNASLSLFSFDNKTITALTDSFAIKIAVRNVGAVKDKPVQVRVTRTFRDGSTESRDSTFAPLIYQDTLLFKIYRGTKDGSGDNTFFVEIDPEDDIKELNESNNKATLPASISSSATLNLAPFNFGIVSQTSVNLIWQSSDPLSESRDFQLEVDTTVSFTSPFTIKKVVAGKVLANTSIDLLNRDSTVYFWRTRFDKKLEEGESIEWTTSSFSYIMNGQEGWAQLRKDQTRENIFYELISDGEGKPFRFEERKTSVDVTTFGSLNPLPATAVSVKIDGAEYNLANQGQPCRNNTLNFIAFDKTSAVPYAAIPFIFQDPRTCGRVPPVINSFSATELETGLGNDLAAFVNAVGVSDSVVIFSIGNPGYPGWSATIKAKLGELGVGLAELNSLQAGEPVVIFGRKGAAPGTAVVFKTPLTPPSEQLIVVSKEITGRNTEGTMKSVLIGPSSEWKAFNKSTATMESSEQVKFLVFGVNYVGEETLITSDADENFDLSQVSVDEFPYLKVVYDAKDEINLTPADWKNWIILYEPVAEGVLYYDGTYKSQTLQEGESWTARFGFANISEKSFIDSLKVEQDVVTQETQHRISRDFKIEAPAPGNTTFFDVTSATLGKVGTNDVFVYVNRRELPEQNYDNNFANLPGLSDCEARQDQSCT